jgi:hypothetical protein
MAIVRNTITNYGVIELNHVSWPETARVFAQLPLSPTEFGVTPLFTVAENGMWLNYDIAAGKVRFPAVTEPIGVLYMGEKEYNKFEVGLNQYHLHVNENYPRLGMPMVGDIYTTNTWCYDNSTWTTDGALQAVLAAYATTPIYFIPCTTNGAPQLVLAGALGSAATIAKVVKLYTLPNGDQGLKVQFTKVA